MRKYMRQCKVAAPPAVVGVLGTAFGCPYERPIPTDRVLCRTGMIGAGTRLIYSAENTGMATFRRMTPC
jgi:hypothetical protein